MTRSEEIRGNRKVTVQSARFLAAVCLAAAFSCMWIFSCEQEEVIPDISRPQADTRFSAADQLIEAGIRDSLFPGAVLLVGNSEGVLHQQAFGFAALFDRSGETLQEPEKMTTSHLFDLASLTKIFATTYSLMHLHSRDRLDLDEPVANQIPQFRTPDKKKITARHLLSHSSGLEPWFPAYYKANSPVERLEWFAGRSLVYKPGEERRYSDPGFMVLGDLVQRITGQSLDVYLNESVCQPLDLSTTIFNPSADLPVAATSHGNPFEQRMVYDDDFGYRVDVEPETWDEWRTHVLRGEVNDGNAWHAQQGIAGHAGLFSTASDLYRLLVPVMNQMISLPEKRGNLTDRPDTGTDLFSGGTIDEFLTRDSFGHGLGWAMNPQTYDAGVLPERSFGHTGFTGTHFVVLPDRDLIVILLTNRQHYGVDEKGSYPNLRELREEIFHSVINAHQTAAGNPD